MNALKRYYSRKEQTALIINTALYVIFTIYTINYMTTLTDLFTIILISILLTFFIGSMILKEILNFWFQKAIYQLTTECDPLTALQTMEKVKKWDLYKGYTISYVAFCSLVYIDTENTQAIFDLFAEGNKLTKSGKDMILIKNYSLYKAYVILNNKTQMKKAYAELIKLKAISGKKRGVSPLYAWFDIEGEYALLTGDIKEASSIFSKADIKALNTRERAHHYYLVAQVESEKDNLEEAKSYLNQVTKLANKMAIALKAQQRIQEMPHEKTQKARR